MLELFLGEHHEVQAVTAIRNVLEVNSSPDNLAFISAWIARGARLIQLKELGLHTATVKITLPVTTPTQVLLPATSNLIQWHTDPDTRHLEAAFGNSLQIRMLVIHEIPSENLLTQVTNCYAPDIVCVAGDTSLSENWFHQRSLSDLRYLASHIELKSWGVPFVRFWATDQSAKVLGTSLAMFDSFHRRLKHERSRVYDLRELLLCDGFYSVESDNENTWVWTGPETAATFLIPSPGSAQLKITLYFFGSKMPISADNFDILVDGRSCKCEFFPNEKIVVSTDQLREGSSHRVDILQRRTVFTADGFRQLGCALHKLKVEVPK